MVSLVLPFGAGGLVRLSHLVVLCLLTQEIGFSNSPYSIKRILLILSNSGDRFFQFPILHQKKEALLYATHL